MAEKYYIPTGSNTEDNLIVSKKEFELFQEYEADPWKPHLDDIVKGNKYLPIKDIVASIIFLRGFNTIDFNKFFENK